MTVALGFAAGLVACGDDGDDGDAGGGRVDVVAAFYPLAEASARVGGDRVSVTNLTPPGVEPHDFELSTDDLDVIDDADVLVHLGGGFQPVVDDVADQAGVAVDVLDALDDTGNDPHVWLDPVQLVAIVGAVRDALIEADPDGEAGYRGNAETYVGELRALDADVAAGLATCDRRTIVTSHGAFGHLAARYGLEQVGIAGLSPDAEPDPARLAELTDQIRDTGVTTVFSETLLPADIAETLAREAGVGTAVLDPIEGLAGDELDAGATYETVMRENLDVLRAALGCR